MLSCVGIFFALVGFSRLGSHAFGDAPSELGALVRAGALVLSAVAVVRLRPRAEAEKAVHVEGGLDELVARQIHAHLERVVED